MGAMNLLILLSVVTLTGCATQIVKPPRATSPEKFKDMLPTFSVAPSYPREAIDQPPVDLRIGSVTVQDFFLYSCVHEYKKLNLIKHFDSSVAYAVEYSDLSSEDLGRIYQLAKDFAKTIGTQKGEDQEHGLPAVLLACQNESRNGFEN